MFIHVRHAASSVRTIAAAGQYLRTSCCRRHRPSPHCRFFSLSRSSFTTITTSDPHPPQQENETDSEAVARTFDEDAIGSYVQTTTSSSNDDDDDDDDAIELQMSHGQHEPWRTLLLMPARAAWRVADAKLPERLEKAQKEILLYDESDNDDESPSKSVARRSNKQLRQTMEEKVKQVHRDLATQRERERHAIVFNKHKPPQPDTDRKSGSVPEQQQNQKDVEPVLYGPEATLAYFKFRLHPNYSVAKRVLEECRSLVGRVGDDVWNPKRILDFGIGCGSASAAALDVFDNVEWIHGIDPSETMREGTKRFLETLCKEKQALHNQAPRLTLSAHLSTDQESASTSQTFDLALFTYTATELPQIASTLAAAAVLWTKLRPGGIFCMIEPGTPDGFGSVRTVRNMLLDCCPPNGEIEGAEECHAIAPCTHNGPCPIERFTLKPEHEEDVDGDHPDNEHDSDDSDSDSDSVRDDGEKRKGYCTFVQTMPGGKGKGEKFSYFVAQKRICGEWKEPSHRFDDVRLMDLLRVQTESMGQELSKDTILREEVIDLENRFLDSDDDDLGLELLRSDRNRSSFGRIINAPRKYRRHVRIDYCVSPGRIVTETVAKSASRKKVPGLYSVARKSRWGGFWPHLDESS